MRWQSLGEFDAPAQRPLGRLTPATNRPIPGPGSIPLPMAARRQWRTRNCRILPPSGMRAHCLKLMNLLTITAMAS